MFVHTGCTWHCRDFFPWVKQIPIILNGFREDEFVKTLQPFWKPCSVLKPLKSIKNLCSLFKTLTDFLKPLQSALMQAADWTAQLACRGSNTEMIHWEARRPFTLLHWFMLRLPSKATSLKQTLTLRLKNVNNDMRPTLLWNYIYSAYMHSCISSHVILL